MPRSLTYAGQGVQRAWFSFFRAKLVLRTSSGSSGSRLHVQKKQNNTSSHQTKPNIKYHVSCYRTQCCCGPDCIWNFNILMHLPLARLHLNWRFYPGHCRTQLSRSRGWGWLRLKVYCLMDPDRLQLEKTTSDSKHFISFNVQHRSYTEKWKAFSPSPDVPFPSSTWVTTQNSHRNQYQGKCHHFYF